MPIGNDGFNNLIYILTLTDKSLCSANQKHARPHLDDEIFRLRRIRRDGPHHKRLVAAGIITVKDFLRAYAINPSQVRRVRDRSVFG